MPNRFNRYAMEAYSTPQYEEQRKSDRFYDTTAMAAPAAGAGMGAIAGGIIGGVATGGNPMGIGAGAGIGGMAGQGLGQIGGQLIGELSGANRRRDQMEKRNLELAQRKARQEAALQMAMQGYGRLV